MKLRHKRSGVEIEGPWCTLSTSNTFGTTTAYHKPSDRSLYYASEWELVQPEPVWRDVTHECEAWGGLGAISHKGFSIQNSGYRVRKVVRTELKCGSLQDYAAFIVEQKEQP